MAAHFDGVVTSGPAGCTHVISERCHDELTEYTAVSIFDPASDFRLSLGDDSNRGRSEGVPVTPHSVLRPLSASGLQLIAFVDRPGEVRDRVWSRVRWHAILCLGACGVSLLGFVQTWRAFRQQEELTDQQSRFLASVSHELRTPLASVRTLTENMAAGRVTSDSERSACFTLMLHEMQRLSALIENVLDFARIDEQKTTYTFEEFNAHQLINDAVRMLEPLAEQRHVSIRQSLDSLHSAPVADAPAIQRALVNLLDNAIKVSPDHGVVDVLVDADDSCWAVTVRDQGPGVATDEWERIFECFYRTGKEMQQNTKGVGIGLSLVRHIAEGHAGTISVESPRDGGAVFTFRLPLRPPEQET